MKIGLFFGSFNPIHIGHLIIANTIVDTTDLDEVWFVVSPHNPLKKSSTLLHEFDRYDLVRAAINDNLKFKVSDIEFHLPKPSYTIDTLIHIQEKYPKDQFALIIGEDNLDQFPKWKNYESILKYFSLYVYPRPHSNNSPLKEHANVRMVESPLLDISATFIRQSIKKGFSIKYLVPERVEDMIRDKKYFI